MRSARQTLLQFPVQGESAAGDVAVTGTLHAAACATCQRRFSANTRFCPFDGQALAAASNAATDPLLGTTIDGRYRVEQLLGEGGMGVVYAVRHTALDKRFALKVLRADLCSEPELAARFVQEARAAASVPHSGLVEITDFGSLASGQAYFVMEYLEGEPLSRVLRQAGALPTRRALAIARQVAEALHAAHQVGVVHRDLKPGNIHVVPGNGFGERVKIVDFGLAQVAGSSRLTRPGIVYGTPHYMSPEQAAGEVADARSDIYSLGVVLFEMLTGRVPFEADTYLGVLSMHRHAAPEPPHLLGADFTEFAELEEVILRCLAKHPADRYPSLAALIDDLNGAEQSAEPSAVRPRRTLDPSLASWLVEDVAQAPNSLAPSEPLVRSTQPWLKLAVVAAAALASVSIALAFRPKANATLATANGVAATSAAPAASVQHEEVAPAAASAATAPPAPAPSPAAPRVLSVNRVSAASARKRLAPRHLKGSTEIVDPWRK